MDFISTLNLSSLIRLRENTWNGRNSIEPERMVTADTSLIERRLDALEDIMNSERLFEGIKKALPDMAVLWENHGTTFGVGDDMNNLYAIRDLQIYVDLSDALMELLSAENIKSAMFCELKKSISDITSDDSFKKLKSVIPENSRAVSQIASVTIGVNLDSGLHPIEAGILSINQDKFISGSIIDKMLKTDDRDSGRRCAAPLTMPYNILAGREEREVFEQSVHNAIYKIMRSSLRSWKPAIKAYSAANTAALAEHYNDLRFLIAAAEFFKRLKEIGYPVCRPEVFPAEEKKFSLKGAYHPELALDGINMTKNDIEFDEKGRIFIFDGANGGGKTVFAKAAALCQALFQLGLFVPAEKAQLSPAGEILLHLPSGAKNNAQSRFTEECSRMSRLMKSAGDDSFIVCDEAFSGTSSFEACAIAEEVLKAMSAKGCRGIFITHIHELARLPEKINSLDICRSKLDNITVKVEEGTGKRLFRVARGETSGLSYAKDIADKYGLSFEELTAPPDDTE